MRWNTMYSMRQGCSEEVSPEPKLEGGFLTGREKEGGDPSKVKPPAGRL